MNKILTVLVAVLILTSISTASAAEQREIIKKELIQSQYGIIGDIIGVGDRVYDVTYKDGKTQTVFERTTFLQSLSKATIIEGGTDTLWQTAGKPAYVNLRIQGVNLDIFRAPGATTTNHRFEVADITTDYRWITTVEAPNMLINPLSYQNKVSIELPGQTPGKRVFLIKEYVQALDGRWIPGMESKSSDRTFEVIWTQDAQAGTVTPSAPTPATTVAPVNPSYTPPAQAKELLIESVPGGATLQVSGAAVGNTPVLITLFETDGTKTLVLSKDGYKTKTASVSALSVSPVTVYLEKAASSTQTPTATAQPGTSDSGTGSFTQVSETPAATTGGTASVTYEEQTIFTSTNIFAGLIVLVIVVIGYMKLYVQKDGKKKSGKKGK